jgi:hypothetical protein
MGVQVPPRTLTPQVYDLGSRVPGGGATAVVVTARGLHLPSVGTRPASEQEHGSRNESEEQRHRHAVTRRYQQGEEEPQTAEQQSDRHVTSCHPATVSPRPRSDKGGG